MQRVYSDEEGSGIEGTQIALDGAQIVARVDVEQEKKDILSRIDNQSIRDSQ